MARPLRLQFEGAFYHVTSRGNSRQAIYFARNDYLRFMDIIADVCQRHRWRIHAYCLMTNHYHLLVETPESNLSAGMQQLNGVYTQFINRKYQRCGHVFQGRFKSILVDTDSYYKTLVRYVLQNPIRASITNCINDYEWTSYHATIGQQKTPQWLAVLDVLIQFHEEPKQAIARFQLFISHQEQDDIWAGLTNQVFLGNGSFTKRQLAKIAPKSSMNDIPKLQRRNPTQPLAEYQKKCPDKSTAIAQAHASGSYTMSEIARHYGLHVSTVSRIIAKTKN